ncbi:MAG: STAS domain-containing protein [Chloroflexaceae bacterium]
MNVVTRYADQVAILELTGRFDKNTAQPIVTWLEQASTTVPANVLVNLAGVNFVDSTALATLVRGLKQCQQSGGELYRCGLQRQVYMIFEMTRLSKAFNIFIDEDHAIRALTN